MTDTHMEEKITNFAWEEFFERLGGPEGLNLRTVDGRERWDCSNKSDYPHARKILADMGVAESQMKEFIGHFKNHGGYCDCEIMLNVMSAYMRGWCEDDMDMDAIEAMSKPIA